MPHPLLAFGGVSFRVRIPTEMVDLPTFLGHLCLSEAELRKIWWFRGRMYTNFSIPSKSGKARKISAPDRRLKMLQRTIAPLLDQVYSPRNPVHGFVPDRSVKTNATAHLRSKFVVNLDVERFFPSISENRVAGLLRAVGVDKDVAAVVARICTNQGVLPQGAPTSPVLSNMVCFKLDKELQAIAKATRCIYTRYADDITFSSYQPPGGLFAEGIPPTGNFPLEVLSPRLIEAFTNNGFKLNPTKSHYGDKHSRRIVTGLKINSGLNVDRCFVRNIRATMYSIETLGIALAQKKFEVEHGGTCDLGHHLKGNISWLASVKGQADPIFRAIAARYNASFPTQPIKVSPTKAQFRSRAVWVIEHFEGKFAQGSAFFLKDVGLVTAAHCIEEAVGHEIDVYHPSKPSNVFKARVRKHHTIRDLAILDHDVPSHEFFELEMATKAPALGDAVAAAGYPHYGPGDSLNVRSGHISSFSVKSAVPLIEVTQKLTQGMSGGPILDVDERVVGVIHKGGPEEGRDFAVHIDALLVWLKE
ncbi:reverse transcriptase domain-containing protein [Rhizobium helianthi]|uniref:RNA-directed DNA polymerase n=1 Tax=Rhizobium helianthi TaxID=1132695 RepID=A0ABW4M0Q0_9HYPH